jgi:hypothetical protein
MNRLKQSRDWSRSTAMMPRQFADECCRHASRGAPSLHRRQSVASGRFDVFVMFDGDLSSADLLVAGRRDLLFSVSNHPWPVPLRGAPSVGGRRSRSNLRLAGPVSASFEGVVVSEAGCSRSWMCLSNGIAVLRSWMVTRLSERPVICLAPALGSQVVTVQPRIFRPRWPSMTARSVAGHDE